MRVVRGGAYATRRANRVVTVTDIDYQERLNCSEKTFDDETMQVIEEARRPRRRRSVNS